MTLPTEPDAAIFPVVARRAGGLLRLLGTAFFLHLDGTFMTARHVLNPTDPVLSPGEVPAVLLRDGSTQEITDIGLCPDLDIAVGRTSLPGGIVPLGLVERDPAANLGLITYEFSTFSGRSVTPSTRKGHRVAVGPYLSTHAKRDALFLELSFEALPGASGAPLLVERDGTITGMIVGHVDREIRGYQVPIGMAIHWHHLRDFGRQQGLGLKMFMTANLDTILAAAHEKLTEAAIEGARGRGIVRNARVVAVVPRREESQLEPPG